MAMASLPFKTPSGSAMSGDRQSLYKATANSVRNIRSLVISLHLNLDMRCEGIQWRTWFLHFQLLNSLSGIRITNSNGTQVSVKSVLRQYGSPGHGLMIVVGFGDPDSVIRRLRKDPHSLSRGFTT
jgi:hypothetical protein